MTPRSLTSWPSEKTANNFPSNNLNLSSLSFPRTCLYPLAGSVNQKKLFINIRKSFALRTEGVKKETEQIKEQSFNDSFKYFIERFTL